MSTHLEASRLWNIDRCRRGRTSQWPSSLYPPPEVATFSYVLVCARKMYLSKAFNLSKAKVHP
jgi:hypothetical protein